MKVSIIIPTYNSEEFISYAVESIFSQKFNEIECVVVDGGSKDGTVNILNKYKDLYKDKFIYISERDNGVFDALNKGVKISTGEIIGWMGADDFYANDEVVGTAVSVINEKKVDICWGDLHYVHRDDFNKILRNWKSSEYKKGMFQKGWQLPHFASFIKKDIFEKFGYFNLKFRIAADYDFFLRLLEKNRISSFYIPTVFLKMRSGGQSNKSIKNIIKGNIECFSAWKENNLKFNVLKILFYKFIYKIKQFLLKK